MTTKKPSGIDEIPIFRLTQSEILANTIKTMSNKEAGKLMKGIVEYYYSRERLPTNPLRRALLLCIKPHLDEAFSGKGRFHWNWMGGKTPINRAIRSSTVYKDWRNAVYRRDGYACTECGKTGCIEAHHIKPFSTHKDLRLEVSNGVTLCKSCHKSEHYGRGC